VCDSNSKAMVPLLNQTCNKAYDMFVNGAFLHLYEKYGVEKDFFQQSFLHVDQIVKNYQSIR
jgi:hypothetical protein